MSRPARVPGETGFTLIEMLVVLIIIAVLASLAITKFGGARDAVSQKEVETVASSYEQAVRSFALDHGGRVPDPTRAEDWLQGGNLERGPAQPATNPTTNQRRAYMNVQEAVEDGRVEIVTGQPTPGSRGSVVYVIEPSAAPSQYRIERWVYSREDDALKLRCQSGSLVLEEVDAC